MIFKNYPMQNIFLDLEGGKPTSSTTNKDVKMSMSEGEKSVLKYVSIN